MFMKVFTFKDIALGNDTIIQGFSIIGGEIALLECDFISGSIFFDKLIDRLLKYDSNTNVGYANYFYYYKKRFLKIIFPRHLPGFLMKSFNIDYDYAKRIMEANNVKNGLGWNGIPETPRCLLALDAICVTSNVIIFTTSGLDPAGVEKIYSRVYEIAQARNKAFIQVECNMEKTKTTVFSDLDYWRAMQK